MPDVANTVAKPAERSDVISERNDVVGPVVVTQDDPRYADLSIRGANARMVARPESFQLARNTTEVVRAVTDAVRSGKRIVARSGGHCYENFVSDSSVRIVLDMSEMNAVYFDRERRAFAVEAGATLVHVYQRLFLGWGVTFPGGSCDLGAGGHICGGGYGPLSRKHGLAVDYLAAVEVVVVDRSGTPRVVVATRDPDDPNHDLWWAHTGGGGGNFGVVTRYWLSTPGAPGDAPSDLLPKAPAGVLSSQVMWPWATMNEKSFHRIVRNHGEWHERNSDPASPYNGLYGGLVLLGRGFGEGAGPAVLSFSQIDATDPEADGKLADYVAAIADGVGADPMIAPVTSSPWMALMVKQARLQETPGVRVKLKAAYLKRCYTERQISTCYEWLSTPDPDRGEAAVALQSMGGQTNAVARDATAVASRDTVLQALYYSTWAEESQDEAALDWMRRFYREMYAETGGVPVPGDVDGGCFVNFPDNDLADPRWNTSGVPWPELFYRDNYPRLRQAKAKWDPDNVFRHALSIELPE
jgi:hypothetical protein